MAVLSSEALYEICVKVSGFFFTKKLGRVAPK